MRQQLGVCCLALPWSWVFVAFISLPWQPRGAALKERRRSSIAGRLPALAPFGAVLDNPVGQRTLEADVPARFVGFNPLVLRNLLALGLKFLVECGVLEEIIRCKRLFRFVRHSREFKSCFTSQSITNGLPYCKPNLQGVQGRSHGC